MATKLIKVKTKCPSCGHKFATDYGDSFSTTKCEKCFTIFGITSKGRVISTTPYYKKYQDVVAFGTDKKTGQEIAITSSGKRIDPSETRYNFQQDPHGWSATGKKVKGKVRS